MNANTNAATETSNHFHYAAGTAKASILDAAAARIESAEHAERMGQVERAVTLRAEAEELMGLL